MDFKNVLLAQNCVLLLVGYTALRRRLTAGLLRNLSVAFLGADCLWALPIPVKGYSPLKPSEGIIPSTLTLKVIGQL